MGQQVLVLNAGNDGDLENAFATFARQRAGGIVVGQTPFYNRRTSQFAALAARHALPTISSVREYAVAGGLMSSGSSLGFGFRQAGTYVGRILNGANPAELPDRASHENRADPQPQNREGARPDRAERASC